MKKLISFFLICTLFVSTFDILPVQAEYQRLPFTDIKYDNASGYLNVENLYNRGIINGKSETKFAPNDYLTREEVAKIIVVATEKELVSRKGTFTDVKSGAWYESYVETAAEYGIVKGLGDGKFGVGERITRQDAMVLIARMAETMGIELVHMTPFTIDDAEDIADYAADYTKTLVEMNVVDLDKNGRVLPKDHITRIDFCMYLDRVLISVPDAYNDLVQKWMPKVKDVANLDANVLSYEDFENGIKGFTGTWPGIKDKPASENITKGVGKESNCALKITSSTDCNLFFTNIKPTSTYFVAYDVKVEGLDSSDAFVRVNYVFETPTGESGGHYNRNNDLGGTTDWIHHTNKFSAPTPDLAPQALRLYFSVRGTTEGCAYIDNLQIYEVVYEPVISYLKQPSFKGLITDQNGESDIILTSYITGMGAIYDPQKTRLEVSVSELDGKILMSSEQTAPEKEMTATFSSKNLAIGDYDLATKLIDIPTGKVHGENHYMIRKRASDFKTKYRFDEYGRLTKDGKPWFVFSSYALGVEPSDLEDFKGTNIDVILANSKTRFFQNRELLDEFNKAGIQLMFRLDDALSNGIRAEIQNPDITTIASERPVVERTYKSLNVEDNDAFMGWQLNNESPALEWGERMGWTNQILSELNFDKLVFGVSGGGKNTMAQNSRMQDIYACDDPYPISGKPTDPIWEVWEKSKPVADEAYLRPIWTVLQVSDLKLMGRPPYTSRERGPNEQELRNMAWQAVCAGAQGISYYAHFHVTNEKAGRPKKETFAEYLRVTDEINEFEDVILSREDTPDLYQKADREDRFAYAVRRYNGKTYVFLVNSDVNKQTATIKLDSVTGVQGVYHPETQYKVSDDGYIDVLLEPLGVEVLVVDQPEPKSADCSLKNAHFSSGDKNFMVSAVEDGINNVRVEDAQEVNYSIVVHKDAVVKLNGAVVEPKGTVSISGVDKLTFTITSEDGKHKKDYVYNVAK